MSAPLCRQGDELYLDPPDGWDGSEAVPSAFRDKVRYRKLRGVLSVESSTAKLTAKKTDNDTSDSDLSSTDNDNDPDDGKFLSRKDLKALDREFP